MTAFQITINSQVFKLIPYGYCQCGCGKLAAIPKKNYKSKGLKKGIPARFYRNHHGKIVGEDHPRYKNGWRKHSMGYIEILCTNHPNANNGYILEHILVCEKVLGKYLPKGAEPHHINGVRNDNRNSNLILCQDHAYHMFIEKRARAFYACGYANWIKCPYCKEYDAPENLVIIERSNRLGQFRHYHKECSRLYTEKRRMKNNIL